MTATAADAATPRARTGRGLFAASIVVALLSALAAYSIKGEGSAGSYGWFAYTPLTSSTPGPETDRAPVLSAGWVALVLLVAACLLLGWSAWMAARRAQRPGGPRGRAAWRYIALALAIAIGVGLAAAGLSAWTEGAVVWSPLTGPVVGGWFAWDPAQALERITTAIDAAIALTMLAWFGVVALVCAIGVALAARNGSPLLPPEQQEG
jgi:hypothetical protein